MLHKLKHLGSDRRLWAWLAMLLWGAILLSAGLIRLDVFGIDEAAARALLLNWSVADQILSTVFVFGLPDLRALLFAPLGIYYSGSIVAAKVFTMLLAYAGVMAWYRWARRDNDAEGALIASGLILISPALITQVDAIGVGPYLMLACGLAVWLDDLYRKAQRPLGGYFFLQLLLLMFTVSLHPAGLAYPLALLWEWYRNPVDPRQQRHAFIGIAVALVLVLILRMGWHPQAWLLNPLLALGTSLIGPDTTNETLRWVIGGLLAGALAAIVFAERRRMLTDFAPRLFLLTAIVGLVAADAAWGLMSLACILFLGVPHLIGFNKLFAGRGFMGQRGVVMTAIFVFATLAMQADKGHQVAIATNQMSATDQLLLALASEIGADTDRGKAAGDETGTEQIRIMSQWPGRTMLAVRHPTFPLPRKDYPDGEALLKDIAGITHLVFNPYDPANRSLGKNLSMLGARTKTLDLQEGGAIIRIMPQADTGSESNPPGAALKKGATP